MQAFESYIQYRERVAEREPVVIPRPLSEQNRVAETAFVPSLVRQCNGECPRTFASCREIIAGCGRQIRIYGVLLRFGVDRAFAVEYRRASVRRQRTFSYCGSDEFRRGLPVREFYYAQIVALLPDGVRTVDSGAAVGSRHFGSERVYAVGFGIAVADGSGFLFIRGTRTERECRERCGYRVKMSFHCRILPFSCPRNRRSHFRM